MTIRVVIADDEALTRERIRALAADVPDIEIVGEARHGLEALDMIAGQLPDLLLIDVEMPELDGFGVIAALEAESTPVVIFVTAFEQYALRAFDVGAIDYLHKPVARNRFLAAIERARQRLHTRTAADAEALVAGARSAVHTRGARTRYVVRRGATHYFLPVGEIDWIDAADNYLSLHSAGRTHLVRGTMKQAEGELDPALFMRIHRSIIVRRECITAVAATESGGFVITLHDSTRLRASRQYADRIRDLVAREA